MAARVVGEVAVHARVPAHANIIALLDFFEDATHVYLVLERADGGDVFGLMRARAGAAGVGTLDVCTARAFMRDLLSALAALHAAGIMHRDLKLSNLLLHGGGGPVRVRLADFGLSALFRDGVGVATEHRTVCGTPAYVAPEVAAAEPHGAPADAFSAGALLCAMLTGDAPGTTADAAALIARLALVDEGAADLVRALTHADPLSRMPVVDALDHAFFSQFSAEGSIPQPPVPLTPPPSSQPRASPVTPPRSFGAMLSNSTLLLPPSPLQARSRSQSVTPAARAFGYRSSQGAPSTGVIATSPIRPIKAAPSARAPLLPPSDASAPPSIARKSPDLLASLSLDVSPPPSPARATVTPLRSALAAVSAPPLSPASDAPAPRLLPPPQQQKQSQSCINNTATSSVSELAAAAAARERLALIEGPSIEVPRIATPELIPDASDDGDDDDDEGVAVCGGVDADTPERLIITPLNASTQSLPRSVRATAAAVAVSADARLSPPPTVQRSEQHSAVSIHSLWPSRPATQGESLATSSTRASSFTSAVPSATASVRATPESTPPRAAPLAAARPAPARAPPAPHALALATLATAEAAVRADAVVAQATLRARAETSAAEDAARITLVETFHSGADAGAAAVLAALRARRRSGAPLSLVSAHASLDDGVTGAWKSGAGGSGHGSGGVSGHGSGGGTLSGASFSSSPSHSDGHGRARASSVASTGDCESAVWRAAGRRGYGASLLSSSSSDGVGGAGASGCPRRPGRATLDTSRLPCVTCRLRDAAGNAVTIRLTASVGGSARPDALIEGTVELAPGVGAAASLRVLGDAPDDILAYAAGREFATAKRIGPHDALPAAFTALWTHGAAAVRALRARTPHVALIATDASAALMEDGPLPTLQVRVPASRSGARAWRVAYRLRDHRLTITRGGGAARTLVAYMRGDGPVPGERSARALLNARVDLVHAADLPPHARALLAIAMRALPRALAIARAAGAGSEDGGGSPFPILVREASTWIDDEVKRALERAE